MSDVKNNSVLPDVFASPPRDLPRSVVIQGQFGTDAERKEFVQTISSHGVEFLRIANAPLPEPSQNDLAFLKKLACVVARFQAWNVRKEEKS